MLFNLIVCMYNVITLPNLFLIPFLSDWSELRHFLQEVKSVDNLQIAV